VFPRSLRNPHLSSPVTTSARPPVLLTTTFTVRFVEPFFNLPKCADLATANHAWQFGSLVIFGWAAGSIGKSKSKAPISASKG